MAIRASEPRERLLRTAGQLFYAQGINSVGIEEVVARAQVTRSTLYRHFPGKQELVVAYLQAASAAERAHLTEVTAAAGAPEAALRAVADAVVDQLHDPAYRGCAFLNAAAEHPDADSPVRQAVLEHRRWYAELVAELVRGAGGSEEAARLFVVLRDGAMAAGCLGDADEVGATFLRGVERLLTAS